MGSTLKVDNIVGTSGTSAPITLSGDTASVSITGVTDGSDASAGEVGEYKFTEISGASVSTSAANMGSLQLTAGDWDLGANILFNGATASYMFCSLTSTSATQLSLDQQGVGRTHVPIITSVGVGSGHIHIRADLSSTTTYYLVAETNSGTGAWFHGSIYARRVR